MYYEEVKSFLKGKDPQFQQELENIIIEDFDKNEDPQKSDLTSNLPDINDNQKSNILAKYKQTDAYKRLLKRQGQAVRRIERIKENFEKKRLQVNMLTVNQKGMQGISQMNSDQGITQSLRQQMNASGLMNRGPTGLSESMIIGSTNLNQMDISQMEESETVKYHNDGDMMIKLHQNRERPHTQGRLGTGLKSFLSSQTPLSHQVIMEERSSIASQQVMRDRDRLDLRMQMQKIKGLQKVQPYMKTSNQYFKSQLRDIHANSTTNRRKKSINNQQEKIYQPQTDNLSLNFSQVYNSVGNFSNEIQAQSAISPNSRAQAQQELNFITGIQTYQQEISKNRTSYKNEQKAFYKPTLSNQSQRPWNQNLPSSKRNKSPSKLQDQANQSILSLNAGISMTSSQLNHFDASRPQTTSNEMKIINSLTEPSQELQLKPINKQLLTNISSSGSKPKTDVKIDVDSKFYLQHQQLSNPTSYRNNLLEKLKSQSKDKLNYPKSQNRLKVLGNQIVKEQEEEYQESKFQSKKQTINTNNENQENDLSQNQKVDSKQKHKNKSHSRFECKLNQKPFLGDFSNLSTDLGYHDGKSTSFIKKTEYLSQKDQDKNDLVANLYDMKVNKSSILSYNNKKNQIVQSIKSNQYWPESLKRPEEFREFYWSSDLSFCGFASNQNYEKEKQKQEQDLRKRALIAAQIMGLRKQNYNPSSRGNINQKNQKNSQKQQKQDSNEKGEQIQYDDKSNN